jgi:hypothetical protein
LEHTSSVISWGVVQLILVSSLAVFAKDDGFITATDDEKDPVKVETAEDKEEESKEKKNNERIPPKPTDAELKVFYARIEGYQFMDPKLIELATLALKWNLEGENFNQETYDEDTKWLAIYKKEMQAAEDNLDIGAYIFFFQEHVRLAIKRSGMSLEKK